MKPKIYVAGPYSGNVMSNIQDAIGVGDLILIVGGIPFIPHLTGFWDLLYPHPYEKWMEYDFEWIRSCDAVYRIGKESAGADREVELAESLGIPVFLSFDELRKFINGEL